MVKASPGRTMVLKHSVRWAKHGYTWAPLVIPSHAGQFEAQANLAEAAYTASNQGMINTGGLPGAAGYVRDTLTGKETNPGYYQAREAARREAHANVPQKVQALRAKAAALRGRGIAPRI